MGNIYDTENALFTQRNLNVNATAPSDIAIVPVMNSTGWEPLIIRVRDASLHNAGSVFSSLASATIAIYTGPGATGTNIVAATALASITTAGAGQSLAIVPAAGTVQTAQNLFVRLTVAAGSAGLVDLVVLGLDWGQTPN
jgi:hypothetical protein